MQRNWVLHAILSTAAAAHAQDATFFETKIRPVLAEKCYACHSSKLPSPMGGLTLDSRAGVLKGGALGPALVPGRPAGSRILTALRYTDPRLQMPPGGKLPDSVIADFEKWIADGAADPRAEAAPTAAPLKGMGVEDGRKWWAFQAVREQAEPRTRDTGWRKTKVDSFVLAKLEEKALRPSAPADPRTLVRRAFIDLTGLKPTFEEVEAFAADNSAGAYQKLIDGLLASPRYGERWGRYWLDVARYAEDNPTSEATNPPYPFAWRYRDWVIEAINKDLPYDRFVKLQLAADQMTGVARDDRRALGYLGTAPIYHKDQRLSEEVIYTFLTDDWDERVDAVSRGLLGLTVACARCHDHKFDPILTKDYYGLAGVFASTMRGIAPTFDVDPKVEARYMWVERRLFDLAYSANLLTNEASTVVGAAERVVKWKAEIESLKAEMEALRERYPQLVGQIERYWAASQRAQRPPQPAPPAAPQVRRRGGGSSNEPFMNIVFDAAQYADGSDANYTWVTYRPGEARDLPVMLRGNVATPGDIEPRHFLTVLSRGNSMFQHGSGRLEMAERIFSDSASLAARVMVNRVWAWHFGKPLVATLSDFGTQGERPTHPELLDDLSARFIAHGWSLKWLHREIMLSAAYRQASKPRPDAERIDKPNLLLWRMNPRRLDIEAYRDSLLRSAGTLSDAIYGPSEELDSSGNLRRTVYARVSRSRLNNLLKLYDFPDPAQTSPARDLTTTPLQQLIVMNGAFIRSQAAALAKSVESEPDNAAKLRALYRKVLARDPSPKELDLGLSYLNGAPVEDYAQVLLASNEEIFWP